MNTKQRIKQLEKQSESTKKVMTWRELVEGKVKVDPKEWAAFIKGVVKNDN